MHEIFRNMDFLSLIKAPIAQELDTFNELFNQSLMHTNGLLQQSLQHILAKGGKRMRPILMLLMARHCGEINASTYHAAVGLELLHTASLVHDDVVDEAQERRGSLLPTPLLVIKWLCWLVIMFSQLVFYKSAIRKMR